MESSSILSQLNLCLLRIERRRLVRIDGNMLAVATAKLRVICCYACHRYTLARATALRAGRVVLGEENKLFQELCCSACRGANRLSGTAPR
jgi:hypothetical protein